MSYRQSKLTEDKGRATTLLISSLLAAAACSSKSFFSRLLHTLYCVRSLPTSLCATYSNKSPCDPGCGKRVEMIEIKNTVRFEFPKDSARPTYEEIAPFVKALNASKKDMDSSYRRAEDRSVYLKFKNEKAFRDAVQNNAHSLRFHYANGTTVVVQMSEAGGNFQYVRVCEVPPEVPDSELLLVLGKYGKVKSVHREKFPAGLDLEIHNGVRGVYMDVEKDIPPALHFQNWRVNIFYPGNKEMCFVCSQRGHRMNSCPKKKNRNDREKGEMEVGQPSTYAGVVNGAAASVNCDMVTETLDIEITEAVAPCSSSKNKKMETKRQRSIESDSVTSGALKKRNVHDQSTSDSDGSLVTVPDAPPALETVESTQVEEEMYATAAPGTSSTEEEQEPVFTNSEDQMAWENYGIRNWTEVRRNLTTGQLIRLMEEGRDKIQAQKQQQTAPRQIPRKNSTRSTPGGNRPNSTLK